MKKRKPIIAGNWKMNCTLGESISLARTLVEKIGNIEDVDLVVCPPYLALWDVGNIIKNSNIKLGAQDMHWEKKGAFTGEISPLMLKEAGCTYVIIGHSERRHIMGETNEMVNKKINSAILHNLQPILCVGELLQEREKNKTFDVVKEQLENGLAKVRSFDLSKIVIAYEPVWAIGTGKTATPQQAQEVHIYIREIVSKLASLEIANSIRIQYGGSVKPDNIDSLMAMPDIDGALVGGASLEPSAFERIVKFKKS